MEHIASENTVAVDGTGRAHCLILNRGWRQILWRRARTEKPRGGLEVRGGRAVKGLGGRGRGQKGTLQDLPSQETVIEIPFSCLVWEGTWGVRTVSGLMVHSVCLRESHKGAQLSLQTARHKVPAAAAASGFQSCPTLSLHRCVQSSPAGDSQARTSGGAICFSNHLLRSLSCVGLLQRPHGPQPELLIHTDFPGAGVGAWPSP